MREAVALRPRAKDRNTLIKNAAPLEPPEPQCAHSADAAQCDAATDKPEDSPCARICVRDFEEEAHRQHEHRGRGPCG